MPAQNDPVRLQHPDRDGDNYSVCGKRFPLCLSPDAVCSVCNSLDSLTEPDWETFGKVSDQPVHPVEYELLLRSQPFPCWTGYRFVQQTGKTEIVRRRGVEIFYPPLYPAARQTTSLGQRSGQPT